jgi:serine/threonine-protein kinase HipA
MAVERHTIDVVADWVGLGGPVRMGRLHATPSRGNEIFSFEYDRAWLGSEHALVVDPGLRLHHGPQHAPTGRDNFGVFLDSSPDRWGRVLLQRREAQRARTEKRRERTLVESDYLLGVYDGHRLGGLRFRIDGGPFLDDDLTRASPPWTSLRELEQASLQLERVGVERDPSYGEWLSLLIAPGRSLGGARPKASVLDTKRRLWIAKFPSANDIDDLGAWESVAHALAYDMNPVAHGDGLTLNISETDNAQDLELALDVAKHFRLKAARAREIVGEVGAAVGQWRAEAKRTGLSRAEQDRMASAFRLVDGGA